MGGREKALLTLGGSSLLARTLKVLGPQCSTLVISAGGDPKRFTKFGNRVIVDRKRRGPMAGLAAALEWFAHSGLNVTHVLSVPTDTPFLPGDLRVRLAAELKPNQFAACAASAGRLHPVIGLWPLEARLSMHETIAGGGLSFHALFRGKKVAEVEWGTSPHDPFMNINTPDDLARAELMIVS